MTRQIKEHTLTKSSDDIQGALEDEVDQLLDEIAEFILSESQRNIVKNNSFGVTGNLFGKVTLDKRKMHKTITYEAPYADFVEYGTRPHNIPPHVLDEWVAKKFGLTKQDAERVAFLIARKIAKEGVAEKPFLRPAVIAAQNKYEKR